MAFILIGNFLRITPSLREEVYIYIPTDANFNDVKKIVAPYILQMDRFEKVADKMSYPQNLNSGRFIDQGMNSYDLVKA
jgi:UPF0755 protein